jgi:hypothetical protein
MVSRLLLLSFFLRRAPYSRCEKMFVVLVRGEFSTAKGVSGSKRYSLLEHPKKGRESEEAAQRAAQQA